MVFAGRQSCQVTVTVLQCTVIPGSPPFVFSKQNQISSTTPWNSTSAEAADVKYTIKPVITMGFYSHSFVFSPPTKKEKIMELITFFPQSPDEIF